MSDSPSSTADTAPPTSPPPPPQRKTSNYLLLGVNLVILLFAIYIVWSRMQDGGGADDSGEATAAVTRGAGGAGTAGAGGAGSPVPTRSRGQLGGAGGGSVQGAGPSVTQRMRGAGNGDRTGGNGGALASDVDWGRQVDYDEDTLRSLAGTEQAIDGVGVQLEVFRAVHDAYPSSAVDFGTNRGIEAVYAALDEAGRLGAAIAGDTDGDGRAELLDGWGRPLVYFSPDDYGGTQEWTDGEDETGDTISARSIARDQFQAPSRFQMWSAGPNGVNEGGLGDDITSWVIRD